MTVRREPDSIWWRKVLAFGPGSWPDEVALRRRFRALALERHPDKGGKHEAMFELSEAYHVARRELFGG